VRIALGARPEQILTHVGGQGILTALGGIGIGLLGSLAATRLMAGMLFGIEPVDAPTFLFVVGTVLIVAVAAAWVPSRRAAKLDATAALSTE
jgi:ABC-type antimicrobial peptide transport system permease subunit